MPLTLNAQRSHSSGPVNRTGASTPQSYISPKPQAIQHISFLLFFRVFPRAAGRLQGKLPPNLPERLGAHHLTRQVQVMDGVAVGRNLALSKHLFSDKKRPWRHATRPHAAIRRPRGG